MFGGSECCPGRPLGEFEFHGHSPESVKHRVRAVVSSLGFFEKLDGDKENSLSGVIEDDKPPAGEIVRTIKEQCKWAPKIISRLKTLGLPTTEELALLRLFDPQEFFLAEGSKKRLATEV